MGRYLAGQFVLLKRPLYMHPAHHQAYMPDTAELNMLVVPALGLTAYHYASLLSQDRRSQLKVWL